MASTIDLLKPKGKIKIKKLFVNKSNGQMSIILPKKKLKKYPERIEVRYW